MAQTVAQFDEIMNKVDLSSSAGYSVLVTKGDSIIYQKCIGLSNLEKKETITPNSKFRIASNTKQFTAICILQLVDQGKLNLATRVNDFVPFVPKNISIEHLLTHTSGLPSYDDKDLPDSFYLKNLTPKELVYLIKDEKILSKPGQEYYYNNTGYHILGYIIEQISGISYQHYLDKNIFEPLLLNQTHYESSNSKISGLAIGYEYIDSSFSYTPYYSMDQPYAAGSIVSTPTDLVKWNKALFSEHFINDSLLSLAHKSYYLKDKTDTFYGYGWTIMTLQGERRIGHGGYLEGYNSSFYYLPNQKLSVVVLTNCSRLYSDKIAERLGALAINKPIVEKVRIEMEVSNLYQFEGRYDLKEMILSFKVLEEGILAFEMGDSEYHKVYPENRNTFFSDELNCVIEFNLNENKMILKVADRKTIGIKLNTETLKEK